MGDRGTLMLDVLMRRRNEWVTPCTYCGDMTVNIRLAPQEYLLKRVSGKKVLLRIRGRCYRMKITTADHYLERCYGGHSDLNNILPACQSCNNARSIGREWRRPKICIDCGGAKTGKARRRCTHCTRILVLLAFNPS